MSAFRRSSLRDRRDILTLLGRVFAVDSPRLTIKRHQQFRRLVDPIEQATCGWDARLGVHAGNLILAQVHRRQQPW